MIILFLMGSSSGSSVWYYDGLLLLLFDMLCTVYYDTITTQDPVFQSLLARPRLRWSFSSRGGVKEDFFVLNTRLEQLFGRGLLGVQSCFIIVCLVVATNDW